MIFVSMARPPRIMFPSTLSYRVAWNNQHTTLFRNDMDSTVSSTVWTRPLTQQTTHTSVRYSQSSILNKSIVLPDPIARYVRRGRMVYGEKGVKRSADGGKERPSFVKREAYLVSDQTHRRDERREGRAERRTGRQAHHAPQNV